MADMNSTPTTTTTEDAIERPLKVIIRPYDMDFAEYQGTRAQLEAEDVIPDGTEWPEGGRSVHWENGPLNFTLKRMRPEGMKGPMKVWLEGDYWNLRWERSVLPDPGTRAIMKKKVELNAEMFRQSYEGRRQWSVKWERYWIAQEDKAFQAFKNSFVPQRKKPGRPAASRTGGACE